MSNYTKSTNFATKDNLTPGDPLKVVRGTEIDTEYNNIATAVATKTDNASAAITGGTIDGATVGATTPATGSFTTLAASGTTTLAGALVGAVTQAAFNTVSTTLNLGGAATAVNLGAATGTATVNNTTLAAKAITASTTLAVTGTSTLTGAVTATAGVSGPITSSSVSITGGSITGITDLAVADGGTGASTAAGGLNNLLPSQTGNANKYLQTDGTNASWDAVSLSTADITGTLGVANGGTGVTTSTGTTNVVLSNSPTLVTPALGTPSAAVLTNATGLPISTGVSGLGTGIATLLATPSSANLASAITDETGSGALVFATSPTLVTPALGTPTSGVVTNLTGTASININGTVGATTATTGAFTTLSATGVTTLQDGTAALPALTTSGDTNTGIFFPAADTIAFTEGGAESLRIDSSGNVGIGTSSPYAKIQSYTSSATLPVGWLYRGTQGSGSAIPTTFGYPYLQIGAAEYASSGTGIQTIGFGYISANGNFPPAEIGINTTSTSGQTLGDLVFATRSVITNTAATERMRLDSSGNLGLGVTPSAWSGWKALQINSGGAVIGGTDSSNPVATIGVNYYYDGSDKYLVSSKYATKYWQESGKHIWFTAPTGTAGNAITFTQAMTLDASGNLGVGTTSPTNRVSIVTASGSDGFISVKSPTTETAGVLIDGGSTSNKGALLTLAKDGTTKWRIGLDSAIGGGTTNNLNILGSSTDALLFGTNATERARIDSSGNLLVGASSFADGSNVFRISGSTISSGSSVTTTRTRLEFNSSGLGTVGSITTNSSATLYNVTSDQRLKENITDADSASSLIDSLQVRKFDWKSGNTHQRYGFIAQELITVAPEAVHQPEDTEQMMAVDYSKLVPMLVKEIQSLRQRLSAANL